MTDIVLVDTSTGERNSKMKKVRLYIAFGIILSAILMVFYWLNVPQDIYTINNNVDEQGIPCLPDRSHDNSSHYRGCGLAIKEDPVTRALKYTADFCSHATSAGNIQRIFVNFDTNQRVANIENPIAFGKGQCIKTNAELLVPPDIPNGTYFVRFIVDTKVNPLRHIHKETQTLKFQVER